MVDYKKLKVWDLAHRMVKTIYKFTDSFPSHERFSITNQLRRAAVSVPTNIAEGSGKFSQKDFANFLQIALGSTHEVEYLTFLSFELNYMTKDQQKEISDNTSQIKAMLISIIKKVRANS